MKKFIKLHSTADSLSHLLDANDIQYVAELGCGGSLVYFVQCYVPDPMSMRDSLRVVESVDEIERLLQSAAQ